MTFELDVSDVSQVSSSSGGKTIDFDAMNSEVVEIVGTQKKAKTVVGFPVGIYDLGLQKRPNYEALYDPNNTDQKADIDAGNAIVEERDYFYDNGKNLKDVKVFSKPRTPAKAIAIAVDFPQFVVDKGKYFDNSNPAPLRLIMGNAWTVVNPDDMDKKMPVIASPFYLSENTNNDAGEWAISNRTTLHKMAAAAELLNDNGNFKAADVGKLLGKPMMFQIQVFMKEDKKDSSKKYYTEKIKFVSEVPEGLPIPELDPSLIHGVNMNRENSEEALKQLRAVVKNTMRLSESWEDSIIKQELGSKQSPQSPNKDVPDSGTEDELGDDAPFDDDIDF